MTQRKETFEYSASDSHLVFPIDYSQKELCERIGGIQPRAVKGKILAHPFFKDILKQLRYTNDSVGSLVIPIPLEAAPLLECFYTTARKRSKYRTILRHPANTKSELMSSFVKDLCESLKDKLSPTTPDSQDALTTYCRRKVFQNRTVQMELMNMLRTKELEARIRTIADLSEKLPATVQVQVLQDCLIRLDRVILDLKNVPPDDSSAAQPTSDCELPRQLLNSLLEARNASKLNDASKYVRYSIKDIPIIDEGKSYFMSEIFNDVLRKNRSLLDPARNAYLTDLTKDIDAGNGGRPPEFEEQYLRTDEYLKMVSLANNRDRLEQFILERCKRMCADVIAFCTYEDLLPDTKSAQPQQSYDVTLMDQLIKERMDHELSKVNRFIQYLCFSGALAFRVLQLMHHNPTAYNGAEWRQSDKIPSSSWGHIRDIASELNNILIPLGILDTSSFVFDGEFADPSGAATQLWKIAQASQQFFGCALPVLSAEELKQTIEFFNKILQNAAHDYSSIFVDLCAYKLMMIAFLGLLYHIAETTTNDLADYFAPLSELIQAHHQSKKNKT